MIVEKLRILAKNTDVLAAALRLWVACTPPLSYTTSRLESLVPPTVIAEFTDIYNTLHAFTKTQPPQLSPITLTNDLTACLRHKAVPSLDQLLPHRP